MDPKQKEACGDRPFDRDDTRFRSASHKIRDDFVSRKSMFLSTYDHIVLPCNGPKIWPIVHVEPINPPYIRRAPGRPKKQRRKTNDEPKAPGKLGRQQPTIRCRRCGQLGHNKRTCIGKTAADRTIPKGGNKTHTQVLQPDEGSSQQGSQSEVLQARQSEVSGTQPEVQGTSGQQSGSKRKNMEQMGTQQSHN